MNDEYTYLDDSPMTVYKELKDLEAEIRAASDECRVKGRSAIEAKARYDNHKHDELLRLYVEESDSETVDEKGKKVQAIKRTEMERASIYRTKFATERLSWVLADREYEVSRDYVKSLLAMLMSVQTRSRLLNKQDFE